MLFLQELVQQLHKAQKEGESDSESRLKAAAKEWERRMAEMRGEHEEEVAAVREEAEAEVQRGRKELGDRVSYLNQELQVRADTSQEHAHVVSNLYLFIWLQMSTHLPCKHNLPSWHQPSNNKPSRE